VWETVGILLVALLTQVSFMLLVARSYQQYTRRSADPADGTRSTGTWTLRHTVLILGAGVSMVVVTVLLGLILSAL
jgi:hypothetical protein